MALGLGFISGSYVGKQEGIRQSQEQAYLRKEFERKYESFRVDSLEYQEKLAVFMTGIVPEEPIANPRKLLERIAQEGQKPR